MQTASLIGVGVDVVETNDVAKAKHKQRLAEYFMTKAELKLLPKGARLVEHIASRFALKEAVIKAFPEKLSPYEFTIGKSGKKPAVTFVDAVRNKKYAVFASITHSSTIAAAVAVVVAR